MSPITAYTHLTQHHLRTYLASSRITVLSDEIHKKWPPSQQHDTCKLFSPFLAESGQLSVGDVHKQMALPEQKLPGTRAKTRKLLLVGECGVGGLGTATVLHSALDREKQRESHTYHIDMTVFHSKLYRDKEHASHRVWFRQHKTTRD